MNLNDFRKDLEEALSSFSEIETINMNRKSFLRNRFVFSGIIIEYGLKVPFYDTRVFLNVYFSENTKSPVSFTTSHKFDNGSWTDKAHKFAAQYTKKHDDICELDEKCVIFHIPPDAVMSGDKVNEFALEQRIRSHCEAMGKLYDLYDFSEISELFEKSVNYDEFLDRLEREFGQYGEVIDYDLLDAHSCDIDTIQFTFKPDKFDRTARVLIRYSFDSDLVYCVDMCFDCPRANWTPESYKAANEYNQNIFRKCTLYPDMCTFSFDCSAIYLASAHFEAIDIVKYLPEVQKTLSKISG